MAKKLPKIWTEIFDAIPDFVSVHDADYRFVKVNKALANFFGMKPEEIIGKHCYKLFHGRDNPLPECPHTKAIEKKQNITAEINDPHIGCPLLVTASPIFDEKGELIGSVHIAKNITERKQAEEALQRKTELQNILNKILKLALMPYSLKELLDKILSNIVSIPWFFLQVKGAIFLTEDKADELTLVSSWNFPEKLKKLCASVPFGECLCGQAAKTKKLQFVDSIDEHHKRSYEGIGIHPHGHYCVPLLSTDKVLGVLNLYVKEGHHWSKEEEDFLLAIASVIAGIIERKEVEAEIYKYQQHLEEKITERTAELEKTNDELMKLIQERNKREELLERLFNTVHLCVVFLDRDFNFIRVNKAYADTCGHEPEFFPGKNHFDLYPSDAEAIFRHVVETGQTYVTLARPFEFPDNPERGVTYWDWTLQPLKDSAGEVTNLIFLLQEVTERKRVEEALRNRQREIEEFNTDLQRRIKEETEKSRHKDIMMMEQSRQASMGRMIGNIAHQWKQPLNNLNIFLYRIKLLLEDTGLHKETYNDIFVTCENLVDKMSTIIDDFRYFYKPDKKKEKFSINKTIKKSLSLVDASMNYNFISVALNETDKISATGFPNEYSMVILNILDNAKDAIVSRKIKGKIKIDVSLENGFGVVKIKDNGGGIHKDVLDNIFEPYFTTKKKRKAIGIGLYICKLIVEKHMNGRIEVQNIGTGTEFKVIVPKA